MRVGRATYLHLITFRGPERDGEPAAERQAPCCIFCGAESLEQMAATCTIHTLQVILRQDKGGEERREKKEDEMRGSETLQLLVVGQRRRFDEVGYGRFRLGDESWFRKEGALVHGH